MRAKMTPGELGEMDRESFVAALGEVFENSAWIPEAAWEAGPFAGPEALHGEMVRVVAEAGRARQLELVRAHPDLAGKAALAGALGADSRREQAGAGLDECSPEELARFHRLNDAYLARFGFPFVMAIKGKEKAAILEAFAARLANDAEAELAQALAEIARIAAFRLADLVADGPRAP